VIHIFDLQVDATGPFAADRKGILDGTRELADRPLGNVVRTSTMFLEHNNVRILDKTGVLPSAAKASLVKFRAERTAAVMSLSGPRATLSKDRTRASPCKMSEMSLCISIGQWLDVRFGKEPSSLWSNLVAHDPTTSPSRWSPVEPSPSPISAVNRSEESTACKFVVIYHSRPR
jgi:hypothetical protein